MNIKLIGSNTCPFVQRCLIALSVGNVSFQKEFIDLMNKPEWFVKISPTGKVPVLEFNNSYIFESLVINEFINEKLNLNLNLSDTLHQAINRSWSEFSSTLLIKQYALICSTDEARYNFNLKQLIEGLLWLEKSEIKLPFFNGDIFSLTDIAFAPLFYRSNILNEMYSTNLYIDKPKISQWSSNILSNDFVNISIPDNYRELIYNNIQKQNGFLNSI